MNKRTIAGLGLSFTFLWAVGCGGAYELGSKYDDVMGLTPYFEPELVNIVEARDDSAKDLFARHLDRAGVRMSALGKKVFDF